MDYKDALRLVAVYVAVAEVIYHKGLLSLFFNCKISQSKLFNNHFEQIYNMYVLLHTYYKILASV